MLSYYLFTKRVTYVPEIKQQDYNKQLINFENKMSQLYPLGDDKFRINHGENYFAFFNRLGKVHYCIYAANSLVLDKVFGDGQIHGTLCGVLRNIYGNKIWYLCDLKVEENWRGKWIPSKMFAKGMWNVGKSQRCYAISMNPEIVPLQDPSPNKVLRLFKRFPLANFKSGGNLMIYQLSYDEIIKIQHVLKDTYKSISYLSLNNVKDLVLESNKEKIKLLHMIPNHRVTEHGQYAQPQKDHTHLFCVLETSVLITKLKELNVKPGSSAMIIQNGMDNFDWGFITTADI
jgi:hypothetical protein